LTKKLVFTLKPTRNFSSKLDNEGAKSTPPTKGIKSPSIEAKIRST
jgi:hypothetical protein